MKYTDPNTKPAGNGGNDNQGQNGGQQSESEQEPVSIPIEEDRDPDYFQRSWDESDLIRKGD